MGQLCCLYSLRFYTGTKKKELHFLRIIFKSLFLELSIADNLIFLSYRIDILTIIKGGGEELGTSSTMFSF